MAIDFRSLTVRASIFFEISTVREVVTRRIQMPRGGERSCIATTASVALLCALLQPVQAVMRAGGSARLGAQLASRYFVVAFCVGSVSAVVGVPGGWAAGALCFLCCGGGGTYLGECSVRVAITTPPTLGLQA